MSGSDTSFLESLIGRPIPQLVAKDFPGEEVLFLQGNPRRYERLDCPAFDSIGALAQAFAGARCFRVLPNHLKKAGYGSGVVIDPKDAPLFLDMGMTVWVRDLKGLAGFGALEKQWAEELGVSQDRIYSQLFISPPGARTLRHFDLSQNLVFQLKGTKRWTIAPYDAGPRGYPDKESELLPDNTPLPGQRVLDVGAGDLMWLPFYWWHSTEALTESWSITVFVRAPTWKTLVGQLLLSRLQQLNGDWAQPVIGLKEGLETRQLLAQQLSHLLADLPRLVETLAPDQAERLLGELIRDRNVSEIGSWRQD